MPQGAADGAFATSVSRLDSTETRNILLREFRGRNGAPFSARAVKPRIVRIEATDITGERYEIEYPWSQ